MSPVVARDDEPEGRGELDALASHVAKHAGLHLAERQRWLLEARVDARRAARAETRARYVERVLAGDVAELATLVESLRVGETRFYRHPRQLRALRRVALPELVARAEAESRSLRIWSAGCASGEEAYTMALLVRGAFPDVALDVLATDLSGEAIRCAEIGTYDLERLRDVPEEMLEAAFVVEGARRSVHPSYRKGVRFAVQNLLTDAYPRGLDLVLCRNVLIYFDAATRTRVLEQLFGAVREGGYVALGYADHAGDVRGAEAIRTDDGVLYRRVEGGAVRVDARVEQARETVVESPSPVAAVAPVKGPPLGQLEGELEGALGLARTRSALAPLLREGGELDVTRLRFADDDVGRELARAAQVLGERLVVVAPGGGIERFLRRHGVVPPATLRRGR
ncbi:MAG: hypothetical protein H6721_22625 [Sandaracinus sp.]|nr:hypothetical protein [Sandaracinus sp.]